MSFFNKNYKEPQWYQARQQSRRQFIKSAAAVSSASLLPISAFANVAKDALEKDPWLTLDAVLSHLLPSSDSGPGAKEIMALNYVYLLVTEQPIDEEEKTFIKRGVGWLNDYTKQAHQKTFTELKTEEKEAALRTVARSRAGENWISTLLSYLFEAMLAPSSYGGNPDGIGWKWLEHQQGFPMPEKGKRYFELPGQQINVKTVNSNNDQQKGKVSS